MVRDTKNGSNTKAATERTGLSFFVIWGSFTAFLALYVLQKGSGLLEMETPFFRGGLDRAQIYHTNLLINIISFLFIVSVYGIIWATKTNKKLNSLKRSIPEWIITIFLLSVFVLKAHYSQPLAEWTGLYHSWSLYTILAILSIPSVLFFLSWLHERSKSVWEERFGQFLQGKSFFHACVLVAAIGLGMDLYFASSPDVWNDEAYTLDMIRENWADMVGLAMKDVHPPFYLIVYKLAAHLAHSLNSTVSTITAAKIAAVVPHLILAVVCLTMVRKKWGNFVAGMGAVVAVSMPYMLYTSQELRLYSWAMLWVTGSWLFLHSILTLNRRRDWLGFVACSIMTAYTYYSAGIAVGLLWLILAVWSYQHRCMKRWWVALGVACIAYLPWSFVMAWQIFKVEADYWMPPMTSLQFFELLLTPTRDVLIFMLIMLFFWVYAMRMSRKHSYEHIHILAGMSLVFIVVIVMCGLSFLGTPIITTRTRYIVPMLTCLWIGFLVTTQTKPRLRILAALTILFIAISEMQSFARVQRDGMQGAATLLAFAEKIKSPEFIIPLQINRNNNVMWKHRTLYWCLGERNLHYLINTKQVENNSYPAESHDARVNGIIQRYGLPRFISPLVTLYVDVMLKRSSTSRYMTIQAQEIKELLDSGKNVYCIGMETNNNTPDLDGTEKLLLPYGLRIDKEPTLHANIDSGARDVYLYKLEHCDSRS